MENLYFCLVLLLLLLPFLFFLIKKNFSTLYNLPPHPLTLPIIGHLYLTVLKGDQISKYPEVFFGNLLSKYSSKILFLKFGSQPILLASCPYKIKECFSSNDLAFADRPKNLASDCLSFNYKVVSFLSKNKLWKEIRTFTHDKLFSDESLRGSSVLRQEENIDLLRSLVRFTTDTVNVESWFYLSILNIATRLVSGERFASYDDLKKEKEKKRLDEMMELFRPSLRFSVRDYFPLLKVFSFMDKGLKNEMQKIHEKRNEYLQGIIDEFRRKKATADQSRDTSCKEKESTFIETLYKKKESDPHFDDDMIKAHLLIMFVAGIETSAKAIASAISLLLVNPEAMKRLREEIDNKVGTDRFLNEEDIETLPFLKNIVSETLRLEPPVKVILPHLATKQCKVGEFDIPEGTILYVNTWAMQRDPEVWDEPKKFKPERFENFDPSRDQKILIKYIPFGEGIRKCPGDKMALGMILLAVGSLVHCFDLEKVGELTRCTLRTNLAHLF